MQFVVLSRRIWIVKFPIPRHEDLRDGDRDPVWNANESVASTSKRITCTCENCNESLYVFITLKQATVRAYYPCLYIRLVATKCTSLTDAGLGFHSSPKDSDLDP